MAARLDKRAARLAITRFGAEADRVRAVLLDALRQARQGRNVDLVECLLQAQVISAEQAAVLREELDRTQIDPRSPLRSVKNGSNDEVEAKEISAPVKPATNGPTAAPGHVPPQGADSGGERTSPRTLATPAGPYRRLRDLGTGGMGEVYLAYDEKGEQLVAIKLLWPHLAGNPNLVERFKREAEHSIKLRHPNIVRGFDWGRMPDTQRWYLAMEYVDGPSVQTLLDRRTRLDIGDAVRIALDIARALEYAHSRNIVHRDIKPENILLTRTGVAKLADLGLSKATDQVSNLTHTRQGFGTPYYMPYEQAMNAKSADGRSDIYALGATLYHMITGQPPFQGKDPVEILEKKEAGVYPPASVLNPDVPDELDRILDKMLARDRRDRYQTASELIVDLQRSNLAAPVLSFVDPELALQDPVVRTRAAVENQATVPDLSNQRASQKAPARAPVSDVWFVREPDAKGGYRQFKASTEQILRRIRQGTLAANAQVSRSSEGPFQPLGEVPVFREALEAVEQAEAEQDAPATPAPSEKPPAAWKQGLVLVFGTVVVAAVVLTVLVLVTR
ncbi:MAG: serine/threonine protein kinase [Gemmatales bacterium]|nr:serine/threonine protein kinase [Gemmatales bacterium]MDW8388308.1 serine/threonine-protein kinase [Gemmatales bacterium]